MDGTTQRSDFTIEVTVETQGLTQDEHDQRVRWVRRNMLNTNSDIREVFYTAAVRDENGELVEFTGAGRGKPSTEIRQVLESYMDEKA